MNPTIERIYALFLKHRKVCTDTRNLQGKDIFFALKGENFNGNLFAAKAIDSGAAYAVVDEKEYCLNDKYILVDDVLSSLQDLAQHHRAQLTIPVIAITGSNGKTTTKELIKSVLSKKYRTSATIGNLNNHIGVPLTILAIPENTEMAVIEMGANHQKEIELLCKIAAPNCGLITNVGKAHLEGFGGMEGVKKGKGELYEFLNLHEGLVFVNMENLDLMHHAALPEKHFKFGRQESADLFAFLETDSPFLDVRWKSRNSRHLHVLKTQLTGAYNFENIAYALSIGQYFKVPSKDMNEAIAAYVPSNMRSQKIEKDSNIIFLDAYNANPSSMNVALESFAAFKAEKKIVILGDMMELGKESDQEHLAILNKAVSLAFNEIVLAGKNFAQHTENFKGKNFETVNEICDWIKSNQFKDTAFLIKGSRKMQLEKVLDCF